MALVGISRAASIAQRVADVTVRTDRVAGDLVLGRGGRWGVVDGCERESSLAVSQAFRGVEAG